MLDENADRILSKTPSETAWRFKVAQLRLLNSNAFMGNTRVTINAGFPSLSH